MAGDDEARAREVLAEMQLRISQGPTAALGIGEIVTADEVRTAFLQLTKQFHPARYGRMSPELQRLAHEVFLGIKGAHDHMLKVLGAPPRGGTSRASAPATPIAEGTNRQPLASQLIPRVAGTSPPSSGTGRASAPSIGSAPPQRATTPAMGVPADRARRETTTGSIPRVRTPVPPDTQPGIGAPVTQRPVTPVPPGTQPGIGPASASASTSQRMPRVVTPTTPPINPPTSPPTTPSTGRGPVLPMRPPGPSGESFNPPTVRNVPTPTPMSQQMPKFAGGPEPFDEAAAFREAASLMERKDWAGARQALHALAAKVPQSASYRAWLHYARGREAYLGGHVDDAIVEMQRALQLEPDLAHAKHALAELQRRR